MIRSKPIPVYEPWLSKLEMNYVKKAIRSTWISSNGEFIDKAEQTLAKMVGVDNAAVTSSGTAALHLCCLSCGMKTGDVVLVPSTTFAATAFAPSYCGATIKFVDACSETWNLNLDEVEKICKIHKVDFVIPVHLLGNPVDMVKLNNLADEYGFTIIEDACESIGASIDGKMTGCFGRASAFSFYGNKTLTCLPEYEPIIIQKDNRVKTIKISDAAQMLPFKVPSLNSNQLMWSKASNIVSHKASKKCLRIKSSCGRSIDCSDDHILMVHNKSKITQAMALNLKVGDYILGLQRASGILNSKKDIPKSGVSNVSFLEIESITSIGYDGMWYDITVPDGHTFVAGHGSIVAHNCGEGGAIVSDDDSLISYAKFVRGQAQSPNKRYWHTHIGTNYRMTNMQAAVLCAQFDRADKILENKERVANKYIANFRKSNVITQHVLHNHKHGYWMMGIKTSKPAISLAAGLSRLGIDTRPMFYPLNEMPPFPGNKPTPVAKNLSEYCLMLPSYPTLKDDDIDYISQSIFDVLSGG